MKKFFRNLSRVIFIFRILQRGKYIHTLGTREGDFVVYEFEGNRWQIPIKGIYS